jgi:hypothetical protein
MSPWSGWFGTSSWVASPADGTWGLGKPWNCSRRNWTSRSSQMQALSYSLATWNRLMASSIDRFFPNALFGLCPWARNKSHNRPLFPQELSQPMFRHLWWWVPTSHSLELSTTPEVARDRAPSSYEYWCKEESKPLSLGVLTLPWVHWALFW